MPLDATRNPQPAVRKLVLALLSWFSANARDLPWRHTRDPYAIWVSEIMLQQTQVKTVIPYWERWMRELPTIQSVAKASPAKLHKLWEGLGYYTRVRNLQKAARQIVAQHHGQFPKNFEDILALPGIGRYTAGAIASITFNQPHPILDGNVIRVLARIFGIRTDPREKKTNARLWQLATELVGETARINSSRSSRRKEAHSENRQSAIGNRQFSRSFLTSAATNENACSHLNQSLMELGALVCTPRSPNCAACPVSKHCVAFREKRQGELPTRAKRKAATTRRFIAFVIERNGKFLVRQRPHGVVNAHLWEFPNVEAGARLSEPQHVRTAARALKLQLTDPKPLCIIKHSITRYRITLEAYRAILTVGDDVRSLISKSQSETRHLVSYKTGNASGQKPALLGQWLPLPQLHKLAFTSAHKKILAHLESERRSPPRRVSKIQLVNPRQAALMCGALRQHLSR